MADEHDTPEAQTPQPQPEPLPVADAPGAALRAARSSKKLSMDELVVQTKLPLSVLQAMEADDFRTLNEPVYVRGYYRKYARVLGLEEAPIIAGYEAHGGAVTRKPEVSLLVPEDPRPSARWPLVLGVLVLLAGLAAAANWYLSRDDAAAAVSEPASANTSAAAADNPQVARPSRPVTRPPATVAAAAEPTMPSESDNEVAEPADDDSSAAATTETSAPQRSQPAVASEPAATTPAAAPGNGNALTLGFDDDSWVRVEDSTGQRLLNGLVAGGQRRQLDGVPPYNVFLGYAPGVSVQFQGEDVAVAPHTRGNNTARFTVR